MHACKEDASLEVGCVLIVHSEESDVIMMAILSSTSLCMVFYTVLTFADQ